MLDVFLKMMGLSAGHGAGKSLQSRADHKSVEAVKGGITRSDAASGAGLKEFKPQATAARRQEVKTSAKKSNVVKKSNKATAKPLPKVSSKAKAPAKLPAKSTAAKKPVAKPVAKPKATAKTIAPLKKAAKPMVKTIAKAAPKKPAGKPVTKKSTASSVVKAKAKPATKSAVKTTGKVAAKPASKPAIKQATKVPTKAPVKAAGKAAPKTPNQASAKNPPKSAAKAAAPSPSKAGSKTAPVSAAAKPVVAAQASKPVAPPPPPPKTTKAGARVVPSYAPSLADQSPHGGNTAAKASFTMSAPVLAPPPQVVIKKDPKLAGNWKTKSPEQLTDAEVIAMPDSEYMNAKQMAFFRLKLVALKAGILSNAGETTEHLREDTSIVPDPADRATIEEEHALELRTRDRERKLLKKIEQSIASIDADEYGYCDETGEPIGVARLIARPTATLSLEAQQRRELKQKMFGD
jgi:DnaK suppressor protein